MIGVRNGIVMAVLGFWLPVAGWLFGWFDLVVYGAAIVAAVALVGAAVLFGRFHGWLVYVTNEDGPDAKAGAVPAANQPGRNDR
jgi:hypothetical protein